MKVRLGSLEDIEKLLKLYRQAIAFMRSRGNFAQWGDHYPNEAVLSDDIAKKQLYVIEDNEGDIVGVFALIFGEDETYQNIYDGQWQYHEPYGTIHRLASSGKKKGIATYCFDYCFHQINYIRIDTHKDNEPMQKTLIEYGFKYSGNIMIADGSYRMAFELKQ